MEKICNFLASQTKTSLFTSLTIGMMEQWNTGILGFLYRIEKKYVL